ncbi:MAG: hypothetical protein A3G87_04675 [Omnitrophica bacterium RIFCSPLOWO2_12_FULL_50_11]|nr:MAG: hypothetical protein A3G87_04675 [Omnitrophica bacterium RIFCSPLOWO2_12_FULL_50_11]
MIWILSISGAAVGIWIILIYNGIVQLHIRGANAWADVDVQLKRRYDLIPNLVTSVQGYAAHEKNVLIRVTQARARAVDAASPKQKEAAEGILAGELNALFAVAENYPQLRASENFLSLQQSLTEIEDALQGARRYYNAVVRDYNTKLGVFPDQLIAKLGRFQPKEFFQLDSTEEAKARKVSLP